MPLLDTVKKKARFGGRMLRGMLPERVRVRFLPKPLRYAAADIPKPIEAPGGTARLLIGPANFAGQGYAWARAAERIPEVGAANMQYLAAGDFGFPADYVVPEGVWTFSDRWSRQHRQRVRDAFTHVLFEAEKSVLGGTGDRAFIRDVAWLRERGLTVGMVSHGTDIRRPSAHADRDEFSPFRDADPGWVAILEARANANQRILDAVGAPVFVSTPDMLLDRPDATWLPIVVDPAKWSGPGREPSAEPPVVLHAPTNPRFKGTALIEPVVSAMHDAGDISYQRVAHVPAAQMPSLYAAADVILEQFALGMYSVTSVEAMAAGRIAVAHVHDQVRDHVREVTGRELPVVEATPASLRDVLHDIRARPDHYREVAARGPEFVRAVHDGALSAQVLAPFLGVEMRE